MSEISLYIHIPFCKSKCIYCDFLSYAGRERNVKAYIDALINEIKSFKTDSKVKTVFIGGGTPSVIDGSYIAEIMDTVYSRFNMAEDAEVTIEANPGTVTEDKLAIYKKSGINRISFGVQAWQSRHLKTLGRIHGTDDVISGIKQARSVGFENINCDLMFSLPNQSCDDFMESIDKVADLGVEHISAYSLIIEEGTPLYDMYEKGEIPPINEDTDRQMYHKGIQLLAKRGYKQYEISNFAKPGLECKHNLVYWYRGEYKGFGLGAASLIGEVRLKNTDNFYAYLSGHNEQISEELSVDDMQEEFMFLGLRCNSGIGENDFYNAFGVDIDSIYGSQIKSLAEDRLIVRDKGRIYLTERGFDIANMVFVEFMK